MDMEAVISDVYQLPKGRLPFKRAYHPILKYYCHENGRKEETNNSK